MAQIFTNGRFYTSSASASAASFADCMVVAPSGLITFVGSATDSAVASAQSTPASTTIELAGRTVLPGFQDGHVHLLLLGQSLAKVSLERCQNLDDIRATIKAYAQANPHLPRILCRSWMHIMTDGRADASMLDDLDPRPIYVDSKDLHSCWCNAAAIKELEVEDLPDPAGGKIHRDAEGQATGLLSEAACVFYVWPKLAKMASMPARVGALRTAVSELTRAGYTGMVEMAMDDVSWEALLALREEEGGKLPLRVAAHWFISPSKTQDEDLAQVDTAIALNKQYNLSTSPDMRITGIKIMCDGVVDACTAALLQPYASIPTEPPPPTLWTTDRLGPVVKKADAAGLQVALHAIGDAAVKLAIDALTEHGTPGRRHRIEHLELTRPGDGERLAAAGITASVQPVHADPAILRYWPKLLGPERCGRAFAYREFADAGANLALGSDAPTSSWNVMTNVYVATTRKSAREPENEALEAVNPQFALTLCQALGAATAGTAYSCFAEGRTGALREGLAADFVVMDMEWEGEDAKRLLRASVKETWFEGRRVYDAAA